VKLVDCRQDCRPGAARQQLAQMLPALGLDGIRKTRTLKLARNLAIKFSAIGDDYQRRIFGFRQAPKLHREVDHCERFARPLRMVDHPAATLRARCIAYALDGAAHRHKLLIAGNFLQATTVEGLEDHKIANQINQIGWCQ
jgi:hypothetical protein